MAIERTEKKLKYSELVDMLSEREDVSKHKANLFTKEYSELLKDAIKNGYDIEIFGIFTIKYVGKDKNITENKLYCYKEQFKGLVESLKWEEELIKRLLLGYIKIIKEKLEQGYQLNLKSIGYVIPVQDTVTKETFYECRYSPVLEKAESIKPVVLDKTGEFSVIILDEEDVHIRMETSDKLRAPRFGGIETDFEFEVIDL